MKINRKDEGRGGCYFFLKLLSEPNVKKKMRKGITIVLIKKEDSTFLPFFFQQNTFTRFSIFLLHIGQSFSFAVHFLQV